MVGWRRKKLFLLAMIVAIVSPSLYFGLKRFYYVWQSKQFVLISPRRVLYRFYNINSSQSSQDIISFLQPKFLHLNPLSFDNKKLLKDLSQQFPFIEKFTGVLTADRDFIVSVHAYEFTCTINNDYFLTPKAVLVDKKIVFGDNTVLLPNIVVDQQNMVGRNKKMLTQFIKKITSDVWKRFSIIYHTPWQIELLPLASVLPCKLICTRKLFACENIGVLDSICADFLQKIRNSKAFPKRENLFVCLDMRFDRKIIVKFYSMKKRGGLKS